MAPGWKLRKKYSRNGKIERGNLRMEKFNIVIGTHGRFGEELVKSAAMIAGNMGRVKACSLLPEYSFEDYMRLVDKTLSELDDGFTIVLVDLYGGTPCNTLTVLSQKYHYDVLTGLNLPMLIDLYLKLSNASEIEAKKLVTETINTYMQACVHTNQQLYGNQE